MAYWVYILQSEKTKGYYIGQTDDVSHRLSQHNSDDNTDYTRRDQPWLLVSAFSCECRLQARKVELHIKRMKSKNYINNLKQYPEIFEKLKARYPCI